MLLTLVLAASISSAQNKALKLDGNGSYVELPTNVFKDLTQATVEVWAKWEEFAGYSRIFEFGSAWQSMSLFNHAATSDLRFNLYPRYAKNDPSAMNIIRVPGLLRTNEWIHLAAVTGSRGMKLYANGLLVGQHPNTASFADIKVAQTNVLGRGLTRNPTDRDFHGEMDELRVWNHQRTLAQIRGNMFKRLSGREEGLAYLWNFDDGTAVDATPHALPGKLIGNAKIVLADLDLSSEVSAALPAIAFPATNLAPANPVAAAANPAAKSSVSNSDAAVWWIAGALFLLVAILAWLVMMLRRSGLGSAKLLSPASAPALPAGGVASPTGAAPVAPEEIRQRALAELTDFAKQSLVQGLYTQRAALLETHQQAQQELAALEARVVALRLPDRIQAYEQRIIELERELETRSDELRELTVATLQVLREKLAEEKQKAAKPGRFN